MRDREGCAGSAAPGKAGLRGGRACLQGQESNVIAPRGRGPVLDSGSSALCLTLGCGKGYRRDFPPGLDVEEIRSHDGVLLVFLVAFGVTRHMSVIRIIRGDPGPLLPV